jgi:hypothetical protein
VIRIYLGRRYDFPAMDMTSYECIVALKQKQDENTGRIHGDGPAETTERIRRFLDECDFAKFTKFSLPPDRWTGLWDDAVAIVKHTTPPEEFEEFGGAEREDERREVAPTAAS